MERKNVIRIRIESDIGKQMKIQEGWESLYKTAIIVRKMLAKHCTNIISKTQYLSDMELLIQSLKIPIRETHFKTINIIKQKSLQDLKAISKCEYER